ncbi:MAG: hypothetical protein A2309_11915, partial [Bacteroidetes bacterium RIFOXYB2_FULL_35_7]
MKYLFLLFLILSLSGYTQVQENFSDGDFTNNPTWNGDATEFIVSTSTSIPTAMRPGLRLNGNAAGGVSHLYVTDTISSIDNFQWEFWVRLSLNPTSTNCARFYLVSDSSDFESNLNGYFIQIGEYSDKIGLCKQTGTTVQQLITGTVANLNVTSSQIRIKVTRDNTGLWKLYSDPVGGSVYQLEGSVTDLTYSSSFFSGIFAKYTSSNYQGFFFDDIYIGAIPVDTTAPEIVSVTVISPTALDIVFSEPVDLATAETNSNYFVTNNVGNPSSATRDASQFSLVHLIFSSPFPDGLTDTIYVYNVQDSEGNAIDTISETFIYQSIPTQFSDAFTDGNFTQNPAWFGDDSLFLCEQISGNYLLRLNGTVPKTACLYTQLALQDSMEWQFDVRVNLSPSSTTYLKVFLASDQNNLTGSLNGYYLQMGESNATDVVRLFRMDGTTPAEICSGTTNISAPFLMRIKVVKHASGEWKLYTAPYGGTNYSLEASGTDATYTDLNYFGLLCKYSTSSYAKEFYFDNFYAGLIVPDTIPPSITSVSISTASTIAVLFSEPLLTSTAQDTANYILNSGAGNPVSAVTDISNPALVHLTFGNNFIGNTYYTLTVENVQDLSGNTIASASSSFYYIEAPAMVYDDFSDGDFYSNPTWEGDVGKFMVNDQQRLELFTMLSTGYDTAYLSTPVNISLDSMEWQVYIKLLFAPSDNNNLRYYLMSDNANLKSSLNGYFLKIGENGSSDAIELYRQDGTTTSLVCRGQDGLMGTSYPFARIKVRHKTNGEWTIYADTTGSYNFQYQVSGNDNTYNLELFNFGPWCKFSSSYDEEKFFYDDIYTGPYINDTISPVLNNLVLIDSTQLQLYFSENISPTEANNLANYFVNRGVGNPFVAEQSIFNGSIVSLRFSAPFKEDTIYSITISNIKDSEGNLISAPISKTFSYHITKPYDVVINEIMCDPTPVVTLPEVEYIELFNRTHFDIDISGWTITVGSTIKSFPQCKISADSFLLVTSVNNEHLFSGYGRAVGMLSNDVLTNSGATVLLNDNNGVLISSVIYSDSWYKDNNKKEGGWSLEQIDPSNPCGGSNNWTASTNIKGGTPNAVNSVFASNPDNLMPELVHAVLNATNDSLRLFFNEPLKQGSILSGSFTLSNGYTPVSAAIIAPENISVVLAFTQAFPDGTTYTVTVNSPVSDCVGNVIGNENTAKFAVAQTLAPNDLVINEILFNPIEPAVDFVEIYNRSNKVLNFKDARIASRKTDLSLNTPYDIAKDGRLIFPGEYFVLTTNPSTVKNQYYTENPKNFITITTLPSFANTSGEAVVVDKSLVV